MSYAFIYDLEERKRQVRHYLLIVGAVERSLKLGDPSIVQQGRLLTLRAGAFLVLYNLIEATTRGAIEAIHDQIISKDVEFPALTINLRKEVVARFKKGADPATNHTMDDFPSAFVAVALDLGKGIKMSGTVDARLIKEFGKTYGFSCITNDKITRDGADLLTIKNKRNDLAHGNSTFEAVGRDYPASELMLIARRTMGYISAIMNNIVQYLDNEDYRERPPA